MEIKIDELINSREKFNNFVYFTLDKALTELRLRKENKDLDKYIEHAFKQLPEELQKILSTENTAFLHRPLISPNYEILRFVSIADGYDLNPVFMEFSNDKFVTRSAWKYALGRMGFYKGIGKKGGSKMEYINIIDLCTADGKKLSEVKTHWGQPLIDFHHEHFVNRFPKWKSNIFDGTKWYEFFGNKPEKYYKPFLSIFLKHSILFENFLLDQEEINFTKNIILPALISISEETGYKPLIVNIEPTEIEGDKFWLSHHGDYSPFVKNKFLESDIIKVNKK